MTNASVRCAAAGPARLAAVIAGVACVWTGAALGVRALAARPPAQAAIAVVAGAVAMLLACSLVEWLVHGRLMHRRSRLPLLHLAYDLHHRAHHWTHYPPDAYVQDEVTYVPLVPPRPERACLNRTETAFAALGQALFYASFSLPLVGLAWLATGCAAFVASAGVVAVAFVALAVHVHDAVHCPGHSPLERFRWFWALDRHHYLHHIDTRANVNFLLPLGDLLLGTLRTQTTPAEAARWPTYQAARARVLPSCRRVDRARRAAAAAWNPPRPSPKSPRMAVSPRVTGRSAAFTGPPETRWPSAGRATRIRARR